MLRTRVLALIAPIRRLFLTFISRSFILVEAVCTVFPLHVPMAAVMSSNGSTIYCSNMDQTDFAYRFMHSTKEKQSLAVSFFVL